MTAELLDAAASGDRRSLARLLSLVERGGPEAHEAGGEAHRRGGCAYTVGLTGAPGSGKSTLTSALVRVIRSAGSVVAVLAIDPSSPFSGGAILGDRVRMQDHAMDEGVFIRSMATRGHLGGLALATPQAIRVLDASGFEWIVVETVGVGQVEVEVAGAADTTVVVVNPGWGDAVQANKAGLMEIADVFVINKADRPGADQTRRDLDHMLDLSGHRDWRPPIVETVATEQAGVEELWDAVQEHRGHLESTGVRGTRRSARIRDELTRIMAEKALADATSAAGSDAFEAAARRIERREVDPWQAAAELMAARAET